MGLESFISAFTTLVLDDEHPTLDLQVRMGDHRCIYFGQNSQVIYFPESKLDEVIAFLQAAKLLEVRPRDEQMRSMRPTDDI